MPILASEPQIAPHEIFALPTRWIVAHVRSRQEKALARYALQHGVPFYLPQIEKTTHRRGRQLVSFLPLFPGYVFLRADAAGRERIARSDLAVALLDVADQVTLNTELGQIRDLQLAGATFEIVEAFQAGDSVRITEGSFAGYNGNVVRSANGDRLIVSISMLRKSVAVEFAVRMLSRARG